MMNLYDVSEEEYANKSKIRIRDASSLAKKIHSEMKPEEKGKAITILDIGCGTGYSTLELATRFSKARVIGIDANPAYIERAPLLAKNVEFYCVDISSTFGNISTVTNLKECSVNIAVSTYWLSSLEPVARSAAIANLQRFLCPEGSLFLLDLLWTDAFPVMHKLNQEENWKELLGSAATSESSASKLLLPESDAPPSNEKVTTQWVKQFDQKQPLELYQIVRNKLFYRFRSIEEMLHVLESLCAAVHQLDELNGHKYFVDFVRALFDQVFFAQNNLNLGYVNLLVVAQKKAESGENATCATTALDETFSKSASLSNTANSSGSGLF